MTEKPAFLRVLELASRPLTPPSSGAYGIRPDGDFQGLLLVSSTAGLNNNRMDIPLVMTVICKDRPGLVEQLANILTRHGGNWLESRMAHLGGQFAGILRVTVPSENRDKYLSDLLGLRVEGLQVQVEEDNPRTQPGSRNGPAAELRVMGQDRPGIVKQIAQALARRGVNVEELSTDCASAAMSGEFLFHATATVQLPPGCALADLQAELEKIASDLMVDVKLREIQS